MKNQSSTDLPNSTGLPDDVPGVLHWLGRHDYIADKSLATVLLLSLKMQRPLFLEGEAGVGKTELAKVMAAATNRELIRLQCYEGLDVSQAVYEWNYAAQMMAIRLAEADGQIDQSTLKQNLYSDEFLVKRPILEAISPTTNGLGTVLLIDELDRADEAFEAFLLEILSDFQVSIPEIGTIKAQERPLVIITTNRTREIHDALKRRCLYHWVDYPDMTRELEIIRQAYPDINAKLSEEVARFVMLLRDEPLFKKPGIAETLDWAQALIIMDQVELNPEVVADTMGVLLKYQDDIEKVSSSSIAKALERIQREMMAANG